MESPHARTPWQRKREKNLVPQKTNRPIYQSNVRFRVHNVQGLHNPKFRKVYLNQARAAADILLLIETNCDAHHNPNTFESAWAQDWTKGGAGPFWASAKGAHAPKCRGIALFVADGIPFTDAKTIYPTPDQTDTCGRILVVHANLHNRKTYIIGFHGDNTPSPADDSLAASIHRLQSVLKDIPPTADIILMTDHNHRLDPVLDYYSASGTPESPLPNARNAFANLLARLQLVDTFRHLHPKTREYTRIHKAHGQLISKSRIDGIFISAHLVTGQDRALINAKHIPPTDKNLCALRQMHQPTRTPSHTPTTSNPNPSTSPKPKSMSWSDHIAVQAEIRYSDKLAPPQMAPSTLSPQGPTDCGPTPRNHRHPHIQARQQRHRTSL